MKDTNATTAVLEEEPQTVDPMAVADLVAALETVFRIGVYYPPGHAMCDQAAEKFTRAMGRTLGKAPSLRFEVAGGVLSLQELPLDPELRGVADFLELMETLGVAAIEMDSNLLPSDLYEFVIGMLAYRNEIKGAREFQQLVIEDMPPTIHVEHLEFLVPEIEEPAEDCSGDTSQPRLETLMGALRKQGLDNDQVNQCRQLMQAIPGYLTQAKLDGANLPQVTWKDVEKLLLNSVRTKPGRSSDDDDNAPSTHDNLNALTAIFSTLNKSQTNNHRTAIDLLLSVSRRDIPSDFQDGNQPKPPSKPKPESTADLIPIADIRAAIEQFEDHPDGELTLTSEGHCEYLTILFQLLKQEQTQAIQSRIQKGFHDILRDTLLTREGDILVAGARQLLELAKPERVFGSMQMLTNLVRSSKSTSAIVFLRDVALDLETGQLALLWPFLVNETLQNGPGDQHEAFAQVTALAANVDEAVRSAGMEQLKDLSALQNKHCARGILANPSPEWCHLLAWLLDTPSGVFLGAPIMEELRRRPLAWICEAVLPLLPRFIPEHRDFLVGILQQAGHDNPSNELIDQAGELVAEHLPDLPRDQRNEPWVPVTLRQVSALRMTGRVRFLKSVMQSRKFLIIPEWPRACRKAAAEALAMTDDKAPQKTPRGSQ